MKMTLSKLDKLVKEGKIIEAFDTYFSTDVVTYDEAGNKTTSKAEKLTLLEGFFKDFQKVEEITLFDSFIAGDTSYSNFRFVFSKSSGEKFQWDEVIIREWKDNLVVSEFYSNQNYATLKDSLTAGAAPKVRKTPAPKKETTAAAKKETTAARKTRKTAAPKKETTPAAKKETAPVKGTAARKTPVRTKKG